MKLGVTLYVEVPDKCLPLVLEATLRAAVEAHLGVVRRIDWDLSPVLRHQQLKTSVSSDVLPAPK
jgi:hypothetical protein